jgi:2-oxoglutarate dehydrogenase E2 component (dihydrolipoamide succinyltransferase)
MSIEVELPSLGESVFEGTVARWLVAEGEMVEVDQAIVEVTTDKVDAEIPAPCAGMIEQILVAEGDVIEIGAVLAKIDPEAKADAASATNRTSGDASAARLPDSNAAPSPASRTTSPSPAGGIAATPVARRMAEEASIDLQSVRGTGSSGRVTKDDILRHESGALAAAPAAIEPVPAAATASPAAAVTSTTAAPSRPRPNARAGPSFGYALQPGDRVIPMTPMRRIISEHMVYSKRTSPHVGTVAELDLSAVVRLRKEHKRSFQESYGIGLTFLPFVVHATVRALREFPALNASVTPDAIIEKQSIHIGVATETEKGLVVPVIRDADRLSLAGTAMAINDLATRARDKRLSADDLRGGTFTVSNPGRQGNLYGFAIINQPQVGILRMGEIGKRPVVRTLEGEDAIVIRTMMYMALSYDHRAVDGAPANGFLHRIRELLEAAEFEM